MRLLKWAERELTEESPLHIDGLEIMLEIQDKLEEGLPQRAMLDEIHALREILEQLRDERRRVNGKRNIGLLLEQSPEYRHFTAWLKQEHLTEQERAYAMAYIGKGENYG